MTFIRPLLAGLVMGVLPLIALFGCGGSGGGGGGDELCASHNTNAVIDVSGTWDFQGRPGFFPPTGTITFSQTGDMVTVTGTVYDFPFQGDRALETKQAHQLSGNRLDAVLTPLPGLEQTYTANVTFLFNEDGTQFCVAFSDTNADVGSMGSYEGTIQAAP